MTTVCKICHQNDVDKECHSWGEVGHQFWLEIMGQTRRIVTFLLGARIGIDHNGSDRKGHSETEAAKQKKKKKTNPRGVGKDESSDFAEREREGGLRQRA